MKQLTKILSWAWAFCLATPVMGQEISLTLGPSEIGQNQYFTITVTAKNDNIRNYSEFPDIPGMIKRGTSSSSSTSYISGQVSSTHSITQNYQPSARGSFTLKPFQMTINGTQVASGGVTIKVGEPVQQQRRNAFAGDPFEEMFGNRNQPVEFVDVKADAFLALTTNKNEVYVGEGFTTTLAFYVAETNRADLRFFDLGKQLTEIVKNIKPERCWEENFQIENINGEPITIEGKKYSQYKLYQATYFPLGVEDIKFPSVGLELIKYKVAKNPTFFGQNRQEDRETFKSRSKTIKVKPLPPHPLRDQVSVGQYQLREKITPSEVNTGQSFQYTIEIGGNGNIVGINEPVIPKDDAFDFYSPNINQKVNRAGNSITGSKAFSYFLIPNEPGEFNLRDYFQWIYFDPQRARYDTLRSSAVVRVIGDSRKNASIESKDGGAFYDRIADESNKMISLESSALARLVINVLVVLMLTVTIYALFRRG
jgi:hypothetical protein